MSDIKDKPLDEELILSKAEDYEDEEDELDNDSSDDEDGKLLVDEEELGDGFHELNPEEDEDLDADNWLKEHDPKYGENYEEYGDEENEDDHIQAMQEGPKKPQEPQQKALQSVEEKAPQEVRSGSRFRQPSKQEIVEMRSYTRPWEQRARDMQRLQADPSKNPVLNHYGKVVEARNLSHQDRKTAYNQLINSDEYKNADPIAQMELDDHFERDWKTKNPDHMTAAMRAHGDAHKKGKEAHDIHAATKHAQIQHIIGGGAQSDEAVSAEEGLQHVGASRDDDGPSGNITKDKAASFAHGNKEFIDQYAKDYAAKAKKVKNLDDMENFSDDSKKDIGRVLGDASAKDPKVEKFFQHYYPLIGMSARKVVNKLGLDPKSQDTDMSMLHEAGMHGLMQAINDYDHDHSSGASFSSHASNKIRGLMHTALRNQDQIPHEVRQAQKRFSASNAAPVMPKAPTAGGIIKQSKHPAAADFADRHKRISTAKATHMAKLPGGSEND